MNKIIPFEKLNKTLQSVRQKGPIVLAGGCFDILHKGHFEFLRKAKDQGDILIVLLESDASIQKAKGATKPVNPQRIRASVLASLSQVDYIVPLPDTMSDDLYDTVVLAIKPAIIATTKGDPGIHHKKRQAGSVNGTVVEVIERLPRYASSILAEQIT